MMKLDEKTRRLLDGKNFGYLATVMDDGSPQVTPVWVDREGDLILVNTAVGRTKQKNLEKNRRVAIAVADASNQYERAAVRGVVTEQTMEGADSHIDKLARKYLGKDRYPWSTPSEKRIILKISAEHISH